MQKYLIVIILSLFAMSMISEANQNAKVNEKTMLVYFTEFKTKTYLPLTIDNIESESDYFITFYGHHPFIERIINILETRPNKQGNINQQLIRLKIDINVDNIKRVYFVDYNGNVLRTNDNKNFSLSNSLLKKLQTEIIEFHGVVDMKPDVDLWGNK